MTNLQNDIMWFICYIMLIVWGTSDSLEMKSWLKIWPIESDLVPEVKAN